MDDVGVDDEEVGALIGGIDGRVAEFDDGGLAVGEGEAVRKSRVVFCGPRGWVWMAIRQSRVWDDSPIVGSSSSRKFLT